MTEIEIAKILQTYNNLKPTFSNNAEILDIFEGNLLPYVERDLMTQLSPRAYMVASKRIPPVNVLKRVIDKLSKIYAKPPIREVTGTPKDAEQYEELQWYFDMDVTMQLANEYFNQHRSCALEPYMDNEGLPRLRVLPFDRYFVMNEDSADPLKMTHFVKLMGMVSREVVRGKKRELEAKMLLFIYKDNEFLPIYEDGSVAVEILQKIAEKIPNPKTNPFGKIPYVYLNRSHTRVNPMADTDILRMTKLIPILMTDVNYAMMFQCFSVFVGIDVDVEKLEINPNAFVSLKSDPTKGTQPKFDVIKPTVDSDKALQSMHEQLALWLQSRNIRPGNSGTMTPENFNSGISKMVDEMDTSDERQKQIPFFKKAEEQLYQLVAMHMHPVWMRDVRYPKELKATFSSDSYLSVMFPEQIVSESPIDKLTVTEKKMKLGLMSKETAMRHCYPDYDDETIKDEMERIEAERTVEVPDIGGKETA